MEKHTCVACRAASLSSGLDHVRQERLKRQHDYTPFVTKLALSFITTIMASITSQTRESKGLKTREELQQLVNSYDNWLFDCDGMSDWLLTEAL